MAIEAVFNREIRDKLTQLLAYQIDPPVSLRIVTPWIGDAKLTDELTISQKIKRLISHKFAKVTLIVDDYWVKEKATQDDREFLKTLGDMGVRVHLRKKLHAKMVLVANGPNDRERSLIISSANLTDTGLSKQKEAGIFMLNEPRELFEKANSYFTHLLKYSQEEKNWPLGSN